MELNLLNTAGGLVPCDDNDYEEKRKLKVGQIYKATIKLNRNYRLHRKYFALINCAWAYQAERQTAFFHESVDVFRKTVEVAAGHCERVYSIARKEWIDVPKSIAFDKMDEAEFRDLYERVKNVLFAIFLRGVNEEEFLNELANF